MQLALTACTMYAFALTRNQIFLDNELYGST